MQRFNIFSKFLVTCLAIVLLSSCYKTDNNAFNSNKLISSSVNFTESSMQKIVDEKLNSFAYLTVNDNQELRLTEIVDGEQREKFKVNLGDSSLGYNFAKLTNDKKWIYFNYDEFILGVSLATGIKKKVNCLNKICVGDFEKIEFFSANSSEIVWWNKNSLYSIDLNLEFPKIIETKNLKIPNISKIESEVKEYGTIDSQESIFMGKYGDSFLFRTRYLVNSRYTKTSLLSLNSSGIVVKDYGIIPNSNSLGNNEVHSLVFDSANNNLFFVTRERDSNCSITESLFRLNFNNDSLNKINIPNSYSPDHRFSIANINLLNKEKVSFSSSITQCSNLKTTYNLWEVKDNLATKSKIKIKSHIPQFEYAGKIYSVIEEIDKNNIKKAYILSDNQKIFLTDKNSEIFFLN